MFQSTMTETGEQDIDGNKEGQSDDYDGVLPFTLVPLRSVSSSEITTIEISWDRNDGEYFFGEDATIMASYGNHSAVLKIYWMRKIDSVDHVEHIDKKLQKYTGSTYSNMVEKPKLLIKNCDESDIGTYHLLVMCKNHLPIYSKKIDLKVVKGPPRVAINPVPLALQNELVEVKATIRGFPKCQSVIWMKNDQFINTTDPKYDGSINSCEFPVLCIKKVTESDNGVYKVIARNELGKGESSADLEVIGKSEMLFISGPVVVSPLKRITFQAYLPGREKMNAKWWKIKDHTKEELEDDNQKYHINYQSNNIVCLEIFWADQEDSAAYQLSLGKRRSNRINVCVDDSGTFLTSKQENRLRLSELLSVSADAMRIMFDSMPRSFANKITEYCKSLRNSKRKNDLLSDLRKGTKSSSKSLDITLMYLIIRNLWEGAIPQNGWGKIPKENHVDTADDIERIRHYRNLFYHSDDSGIDTNVFNFSCLDLFRAIGRLSSYKSDLIKASCEIMNRVSTKREYLQEMIEKTEKEKKFEETPFNEDPPSPLSFLQDDARDDGPMHRASPSPSNKDISYQSSSVNENMDEDLKTRASPSSSNKDRFSSQSLFLHENRDEAPRHTASPSMTNQGLIKPLNVCF